MRPLPPCSSGGVWINRLAFSPRGDQRDTSDGGAAAAFGGQTVAPSPYRKIINGCGFSQHLAAFRFPHGVFHTTYLSTHRGRNAFPSTIAN